MTTFVEGKRCSIDMLRKATDEYIVQRTKNWQGACWYKPNTALYLAWDDETIYQVGEILSCTKSEAESILQLLKVSGRHFVFATYTRETKSLDEYEEEFDEDGWLVDSGESASRKRALRCRYSPGTIGHRYLGVLSSRGLRLQTQLILYDGAGRIFFPTSDIPILAEYALTMAQRYHQVRLRQMRFMLHLQVFYLVAFCSHL